MSDERPDGMMAMGGPVYQEKVRELDTEKELLKQVDIAGREGFDKLAMNGLKMVRNKYHNPTPMKGEIFSEMPKQQEVGPTKVIQEIVVDDPRQRIHEGAETTVRVLRRVSRVPVNPQEKFYIQPVKTIEVIKEYTFEDWDAGLGVEI